MPHSYTQAQHKNSANNFKKHPRNIQALTNMSKTVGTTATTVGYLVNGQLFKHFQGPCFFSSTSYVLKNVLSKTFTTPSAH